MQTLEFNKNNTKVYLSNNNTSDDCDEVIQTERDTEKFKIIRESYFIIRNIFFTKNQNFKHKMEKNKILEKIRERRKILGFSQAEIAKKLGISQGQYSCYEGGRSEMNLDKFLQINHLLGLRLADFDSNPEMTRTAKMQLIEKVSDAIQEF